MHLWISLLTIRLCQAPCSNMERNKKSVPVINNSSLLFERGPREGLISIPTGARTDTHYTTSLITLMRLGPAVCDSRASKCQFGIDATWQHQFISAYFWRLNFLSFVRVPNMYCDFSNGVCSHWASLTKSWEKIIFPLVIFSHWFSIVKSTKRYSKRL